MGAYTTGGASGATGYLGVNRPRVAGFSFGMEGGMEGDEKASLKGT